jgi:hypothetical protein
MKSWNSFLQNRKSLRNRASIPRIDDIQVKMPEIRRVSRYKGEIAAN